MRFLGGSKPVWARALIFAAAPLSWPHPSEILMLSE